ncbi:MAG TPA: DUF1624 domain-containing protein [Candidatus Aenigmarchaeota archaeon]|nr:DUF1624 domain-containing protein [Candidatus Aenigmarchaeota archaeon]
MAQHNRFLYLNLFLGFFVLYGLYLSNFSIQFLIGLFPLNFQTFDYYPLFPWFGIF